MILVYFIVVIINLAFYSVFSNTLNILREKEEDSIYHDNPTPPQLVSVYTRCFPHKILEPNKHRFACTHQVESNLTCIAWGRNK